MGKFYRYFIVIATAVSLVGCNPIQVETNSFDCTLDILDANGNPTNVVVASSENGQEPSAQLTIRIGCSHKFFIEKITSSFQFENADGEEKSPNSEGYVTIVSRPRKVEDMDKEKITVIIRDSQTGQKATLSKTYTIYPFFLLQVIDPIEYVQDGEDMKVTLKSSIPKIIVKGCTFMFNEGENYLFRPGDVITLATDPLREDGYYYKTFTFRKVKVDRHYTDQPFILNAINYEKESELATADFSFDANTKFTVAVDFLGGNEVIPVITDEERSRCYGNIQVNIHSSRNKLLVNCNATVEKSGAWLTDSLTIKNIKFNDNNYASLNDLGEDHIRGGYQGTFTGTMYGYVENETDIYLTFQFIDPDDPRQEDRAFAVIKKTIHIQKTKMPETIDVMCKDDNGIYRSDIPSFIDYYDENDIVGSASRYFKFSFPENSEPGGYIVSVTSSEDASASIYVNNQYKGASYSFDGKTEKENLNGEFEIRGGDPGEITLRIESSRYRKGDDHECYKEYLMTVKERVALLVNIRCNAEQNYNDPKHYDCWWESNAYQVPAWIGEPMYMSYNFCTWKKGRLYDKASKFRPNLPGSMFSIARKGTKPPTVESKITTNPSSGSSTMFNLNGTNNGVLYNESGTKASFQSQTFTTSFDDFSSRELTRNETDSPYAWFVKFNPVHRRRWKSYGNNSVDLPDFPFKGLSFNITDVNYDSQKQSLRYIVYLYECYDSDFNGRSFGKLDQEDTKGPWTEDHWQPNEPWWLDGKTNEDFYGEMKSKNLETRSSSVVRWTK